MQKKFKSLLLLLVYVPICLIMTACQNPAAIMGKYELSEITALKTSVSTSDMIKSGNVYTDLTAAKKQSLAAELRTVLADMKDIIIANAFDMYGSFTNLLDMPLTKPIIDGIINAGGEEVHADILNLIADLPIVSEIEDVFGSEVLNGFIQAFIDGGTDSQVRSEIEQTLAPAISAAFANADSAITEFVDYMGSTAASLASVTIEIDGNTFIITNLAIDKSIELPYKIEHGGNLVIELPSTSEESKFPIGAGFDYVWDETKNQLELTADFDRIELTDLGGLVSLSSGWGTAKSALDMINAYGVGFNFPQSWDEIKLRFNKIS